MPTLTPSKDLYLPSFRADTDPWLQQVLTSRMPATGPMIIREQYTGQLCPYADVSTMGANADMIPLYAGDEKLLAVMYVNRVKGSCFVVTALRSVLGQEQDLQDVSLSLRQVAKERYGLPRQASFSLP